MARSSSFNSVMKARDDDAPMQGRGSDLPISPYVHHSTCSSEVSAPRRERCDLAAQPVTPRSRRKFGALPQPSPCYGAPSRGLKRVGWSECVSVSEYLGSGG